MEPHFYYHLIAQETGTTEKVIHNLARLFDDGATVPFISRYRKELTGEMDEVKIQEVKNRIKFFRELEERRQTILETIEKQGKLTPELKNSIKNCLSATELEDIYLPYKPKRKTRAVMAIEKGLEPLASIIFKQENINPEEEAKKYFNDKVKDIAEALQGARDIMAEWINEDSQARQGIRNIFASSAIITSKIIKGKEPDGAKYLDYFDWQENLKRCPAHRLLAMRRGEQEGFLRVTIRPAETEKAVEWLEKKFVKSSNAASLQVKEAVRDSYKRLLEPSIENEFAALSKEKADMESIRVFSENLRQLLLAPPLGPKRVMAIDPGYKSGCKVVILNEQGQLVHNDTIYPHPPQMEHGKSAAKISQMAESYRIEAIAIGNGTASRETEHFIRNIRFNRDVKVFMVNESGASVYSASEVARQEFPEFDVTVRGSVSIGRRLIDPLAELVKIDPKSIGVGQYQHDVDQGLLRDSLDQTVISCVNLVGVDVNTASPHLLSYVSGVGPQLAKNIVDFRIKNGTFTSRSQLKSVPRMGEKSFEQCAGFIRIRDGINPLDNTAVHPESYPIVEKMAADTHVTIAELVANKKILETIDLKQYITEKAGLPTLKDIMAELAKPGRDPRTQIKIFEFARDIFSIHDLKPGMVLPGIVTNITNFGAFVDVGIHQDGLVHISQLKEGYVSNPAQVVKLNQHVMVKVLSVDLDRNRIQFTMKDVKA